MPDKIQFSEAELNAIRDKASRILAQSKFSLKRA
jgi:hypothetical protein